MGFSHRRSVPRPLFRTLHGLLGYQRSSALFRPVCLSSTCLSVFNLSVCLQPVCLSLDSQSDCLRFFSLPQTRFIFHSHLPIGPLPSPNLSLIVSLPTHHQDGFRFILP